jgi:hypothetical protein
LRFINILIKQLLGLFFLGGCFKKDEFKKLVVTRGVVEKYSDLIKFVICDNRHINIYEIHHSVFCPEG